MKSDLELGLRLCVLAGACVKDVLIEGERQHPDRTLAEGLQAAPHLRRAVKHLAAHANGDRSEPHLKHAVVRLLMYLHCASEVVTAENDIIGPEDFGAAALPR